MTDFLKKVPPNNVESEMIVLGSIIMDNAKIGEVDNLLRPEDFYTGHHQVMYREMLKMVAAGQAIDAVTLHSRLGEMVPASVIGKLLDGLPKSSNVLTHAMQVRESSILRQIIAQSANVINVAYGGDVVETVTELLKIPLDEYNRRYHTALSERVREWVSVSSGYFRVRDVYQALGLVSRREENNCRQAIYTMCKKGELAKHPSENERYRKVEDKSEPLDWMSASEDEHPMVLPFGLSSFIQILPRSIVCVAGTPNAGKTAFCLETTRLNMDKMRVHYLTSELGPTKLRSRLKKFRSVEFPGGWKFEPFYRSSGFPDAVSQFPDDLSIIDFIEVSADAFLIGDIIKGIFDNIKNGVVLIALQKKFGADMGRGAEFSLEKPSLYVSMEKGWAKIVKAKEWREGTDNPNGKIRPFKLFNGAEFSMQGEWEEPESYDAAGTKHPWSPKKRGGDDE